ncbi:MAG: glycosyltransferase family 39 protein [Patescibacteria group bacterium]
MKNIPRHILVLAAATTLISLAYAFYWHDRPRVDAAAYDKIGWNLAQGFGYIEEASNVLTPELDWALIRVGPGYQFFLAAVYWIFGHKIWTVWVLQALLRGASVILMWFIVRRLFPDMPRAATIASVLFAFTPDLIVVSGLLLTETLFIFVFLAALLVTFTFFDRRQGMLLILAAVLWPFAILIRPTALLAFGFVLLLLGWRRDWRALAVLALATICIIGPWSYTVSERYGRFILTTSVGSYDLWVGNHKGAAGGFEKTPEIQHVRNTVTMNELDRISRGEYKKFLFESPGEFIVLQIKKAALYFSLIRPTGFWIHLADDPIHRLLTLVASGILTALLFIGGIAGLLMLIPRIFREVKILFLGAVVVLQPMSVIPIIVESRYRFVLYPLLAITAAFLIAHKKDVKSRRVVVIALALLGIATMLDILFHGGAIVRRLQDALAL